MEEFRKPRFSFERWGFLFWDNPCFWSEKELGGLISRE
jgi:hypothetical protein